MSDLTFHVRLCSAYKILFEIFRFESDFYWSKFESIKSVIEIYFCNQFQKLELILKK